MPRTRELVFSPNRMRKARLRKDWSQADLARETHETEGNIGRWERGDVRPPGDFVAVMAKATGRDIEFFYIESDADEDEEKMAALRQQAHDLVAPLNESMVDALLAECRERVTAREQQEGRIT